MLPDLISTNTPKILQKVEHTQKTQLPQRPLICTQEVCDVISLAMIININSCDAIMTSSIQLLIRKTAFKAYFIINQYFYLIVQL